MILADLGAEVVKVEPTGSGDRARGIGPRIGGMSAYFQSVNRGKASVALDLKRPRGRDIALELASRSDVLVENFRPGAAARLGLGFEAVLARNPRIVYASITGFGQTGPYRSRPALDIIVQALGGMMSVTGEEGGRPVRPGASLGDSVAGLFAAIAILAALHRREATGAGERIDMAMLDGQVALLENAFARYFATGEVPGPTGTRHPALTPFQAFATADGHVAVALLHDDAASWERFCERIDRPALGVDPRFRDGAERTARAADLIPLLEASFLARTTAEWTARLGGAGIPCAPVQGIDRVAADPQVLHRGMMVQVPRGEGTATVANTPFRFLNAPSGPAGGAPELGEQTAQVLQSVLGMTGEEMDRLAADGVIAAPGRRSP
jgi:CoA:oxalate CoA-transferase